MMTANTSPHIGTLAEKSLHAGLKEWLVQPNDQLEVQVDGFVIDIVRGELLIEIQTRNFSALKRKLSKLLPNHKIHLLHPIAQEKWIVRQSTNGDPISRRKSPKRGRIEDIFNQLIYIPHLLTHPNLTIKVLLTQEEEILHNDGQGSWRRKRWSIHDRRLLNVVRQDTFKSFDDWLALLPPTLPQPFTNANLAKTLPCPPPLAQKITYTLRKIEAIEHVGKEGRSNLYQLVTRKA